MELTPDVIVADLTAELAVDCNIKLCDVAKAASQFNGRVLQEFVQRFFDYYHETLDK